MATHLPARPTNSAVRSSTPHPDQPDTASTDAPRSAKRLAE